MNEGKHECEICCEKYNKSFRKKIACPHCQKETCMQCVKKYLLDMYGDSNCLHCKVGWNNEFMRSSFPSTWISKDYKIHREQILFDIEKAKMPETQEYAKVVKESFEARKALAEIEKMLASKKKDYDDVQEKYRNQQQLIGHLNIVIRNGIKAKKPAEKKQFIMTCPLNECCGYLSTFFQCGICNHNFCKHCHVNISKNENENGDGNQANKHVCDENLSASIALVNKDSKPCPSCSAMIHKLSGCDQMWCTRCANAFSWKTGKLQSEGVVHNPHYFQWLRENGDVGGTNRNINRNPCGDLYVNNIRYNTIRTLEDEFANLVRLVRHISAIELDRHRLRPHVDGNQYIRALYMLGSISEIVFKSTLQKQEKEKAKKQQMFDIFTMFIEVVDDMIRQTVENEASLRAEIEKFRVYTNECFEKCAKQYQCARPIVIFSDFSDCRSLNYGNFEAKSISTSL